MAETFCPVNEKHRLSATKNPNEYYCYACAEYYKESQLTSWEVDSETLEPKFKTILDLGEDK